MTAELRPSQVEFLSYAETRHGVLLDGGMGVGKTRCAIEHARRIKAREVLVKAPVSVLPSWKAQWNQYDPDVRVICPTKGTVAKRAAEAAIEVASARAAGQRVAVLVNYEATIGAPWEKYELSQVWPLVVLDESHRIKSASGVASKLCAKLRRRSGRVLAMTGTPMPHSPLDIFAQARAVQPNEFGASWIAFRSRYAIMGGFEGHEVIGYRNMGELREKLARFTFQIPRSVLGLAKPTDIEISVELSDKALRAYKQMERDFVAQLEAGEVTAANALVKLLRLQQITGGTVPLDGGEGAQHIDSTKERALREIIEGLPKGEPLVVFARFRADLAAVHRAAAACFSGAVPSLELSGTRNELARWQAGEGQVLAVQTQSGSVGIDLTRACTAVFYSTSWSLGEYDQARARIDRPPQARPVVFYHLLAQGTIDMRVRRALDSRREVVDMVVSELRSARHIPDFGLRRSR